MSTRDDDIRAEIRDLKAKLAAVQAQQHPLHAGHLGEPIQGLVELEETARATAKALASVAKEPGPSWTVVDFRSFLADRAEELYIALAGLDADRANRLAELKARNPGLTGDGEQAR